MPVTGSNLSTYELSIRIFADGFSFLVTQVETGDLMHREDIREVEGEEAAQALRNTLSGVSLSRYEYNKVRAIALTPSTTIPAGEVSESEYEATYATVYPQADLQTNKVLGVSCPSLGVTELFVLPCDLHEALLQSFPSIELTCTQACLMQHAMEIVATQSTTEPSLYAHIQQDSLHILSIHDGQLRFANTFPADNLQNALFFLLSVWKELGYDAKQQNCIVSGNRYLSAQFSELVSKYILHLQRIEIADVALS